MDVDGREFPVVNIGPLLDSLARHRREIRNESPGERDARQHDRAWEVARSLGSTKRNVVRAMLALVIADEVPDPKPPAEPAAPGAKAVLKPRKQQLFECYLCGRHATRALVVAVGDRWRCKSGDACQRRIRARPGSYNSQEGLW